MARSAKDRQRAYRIEHKLQPIEKGGKGMMLADLDDDDRDFITSYRIDVDRESAVQASERIISTHVEERSLAQAQGPGAIESVDSAALLAREEGRRQDVNTKIAIDALKDCVVFYRGLAADLAIRSKDQDAAHVELLNAMRDHFIARTSAEATIVANEKLAAAQTLGTGPLAQAIEIIKLVKDPEVLGLLQGLLAGIRGEKKPDQNPANKPADQK